ncbi:MAG TPA: response regulator [Terriglobales bacterium]|jgi:CheY-like chemotaxis protein
MPLVVLVVDDSMLIRHTVCRYLEDRGFAVETAANGQDALDALKRVRPALIITDIRMPKMNGSEFITALKANPATANIPIAVVTGKQNAEKEKRADYAIFKDIEIEEQLGKAVQALLGSSSAHGKSAGN